jgi:nucleoside 2-deoxyribosyltransferase
MKIYVGCALTNAPQEFCDSVYELKRALRGVRCEVFDFLGTTKGTPADVYRRDIIECVEKCDLFIAVCDFPSTGLGYEISHALSLDIRVLACAHEEAQVSRLIAGIPNRLFSLHRYRALEHDIPPMVSQKMKRFFA